MTPAGSSRTAASVEQTVIDVDLRERYEDLLSYGSFTEIQRVFAESLGIREGNVNRVLVVGDVRELDRQTRGIERIVHSPGVDKVICLAVGAPLDQVSRGLSQLTSNGESNPMRVALRKPHALAPHAVIWVGDARGIGWEMGQHRSQSVAAGYRAEAGPILDALIDALLVPKVFDRVYDVVSQMPDGAASPGLRAMTGRVDDDVLADARVRAVDRILAPRPQGNEDLPADNLLVDPLRLLLRVPRVAGADEPVLTPHGPMNGVFTRCRGRVTQAKQSLNFVNSPGAALQRLRGEGGRLLGGGGPSYAGTLVANVTGVGGELDRAGAELAGLFERFDSLQPLGTSATVELNRQGFDLTPPPGVRRTEILASLRHLAENALVSPRPISEITGWLTWMHGALVPTGSKARLDQLHRVRDPETVGRLLRMPRRLNVNLLSGWALLPVLLCCLLAAAAPGTTGVGPLAALVATLLVATKGWQLVLARRMGDVADQALTDLVFLAVLLLFIGSGAAAGQAVVSDQPRSVYLIATGLAAVAVVSLVGWRLVLASEIGQVDRSPVDLVGLVVWASLSGVVGVWLVDEGVVDGALTVPVQVAAALLAVVGLIWWPLALWSRAVRRWRPDEYVQLADAVTTNLYDLAVDVARFDWSLTGPRRNAADLVRAMSIAFEDVTSVLTTYADRLRGYPAQPPRGAEAGLDDEVALQLRKKATEITSLVESDVLSLVATVIEHSWPDIEREALDALADRITSETATGLSAYGRHLERVGIHSAPPFGDPADNSRGDLVDAVWRDSERVGSLLRAAVTDSGLLQLCAPEHLQLLDVNPAGARAVRFAPTAAQPALIHRGSGGFGGIASAGPVDALPPTVLSELVWTEWGQVAGVMRLVPMRPGTIETIMEEGT